MVKPTDKNAPRTRRPVPTAPRPEKAAPQRPQHGQLRLSPEVGAALRYLGVDTEELRDSPPALPLPGEIGLPLLPPRLPLELIGAQTEQQQQKPRTARETSTTARGKSSEKGGPTAPKPFSRKQR